MSLLGMHRDLVRLLASSETPLPFVRRYTRETTPNQRYQAVSACTRLQVATRMTSAFLLNELESLDFEMKMDYEDAMSEGELSDTDSDDEILTAGELCLIAGAVEIFSPGRPSIKANINPLAPRRTINSFTETECMNNFRFTKAELHQLFSALNVPAYITAIRRDGKAGHKYEGEELFLLMLRRMALVGRFVDYEKDFNRPYNELCEGFNTMMLWTDNNYGHLVDGSIQPPAGWVGPSGLGRWSSELPAWGDAVSACLFRTLGFVLALLAPVFGTICCFIDGTFQYMSRPTGAIQRAFWTRYKKSHGIIFQAIMAPCGIIIDIWGPGTGRHNDNWLVNMSGINARLTALFAGPVHYTCLGDGIYTVTNVIVRRFRAAVLNAFQTFVNRALSSEREAVEHGFAKIFNLWKYTDHEMNVRLFKSAIGCGRAYRVAVLLTNCHTCLRGHQVALRYGCSPPSIASYLQGGTRPQNMHI